MKICFLSFLYSDKYYGGGIPTAVGNLSKAIAAIGHQITIVTTGSKASYVNDDGIQIVSTGISQSMANGFQLYNPVFLLNKIRWMWNSAKYISSQPFDCVCVPDGGFEHLFLFKKVPIIVRTDSCVTAHKEVPVAWLFDLMEKIVLKTADGLMAPTSSVANYLAATYKIKRDIRVIPCAVDTRPHYKNINIRAAFRLQNKKIILYVGRLDGRKGIHLFSWLAQQCQQDPHMVFVVIGPNVNNFDIAQFPANVLFRDYVSHDELCSFYEACDLLISPTRFETFGLNVAEAMAFGKPVLAADAVGVKDLVVDGETGRLFKVGDQDELLRIFKELIQDEKQLVFLGERGKYRSQQYSGEPVAKKVISYFEQVIRNKRMHTQLCNET